MINLNSGFKSKWLLTIFTIVLLLAACTDNITDSATCKNKNLKATADGNAFESCVITFAVGYPGPGLGWIQAGKDDDQIHLFIPTRTGTFILGDTGKYSASFVRNFASASGATFATDSLHSGTVTITTYDAVNKTISGTFNFTGIQTYPAGGTATASVSGGTFADIKW